MRIAFGFRFVFLKSHYHRLLLSVIAKCGAVTTVASRIYISAFVFSINTVKSALGREHTSATPQM